MQIDSTVWATSTFSPTNTWAHPFSPQYTGEAGYAADNIPGQSSTPVTYSSVGVENNSGDDVLIPCGLALVNDYPSRWGHLAHSCTSFDIFTTNP